MNNFQIIVVDLPNLTYISSSGGECFECPRSVTFESIGEVNNIWKNIDIPSLQYVYLPSSFEDVETTSISSIVLFTIYHL